MFIRQPEGFVDAQRPYHVCKLVKALYGFKQALRAWFDKLRVSFQTWNFRKSKSNASLFVFSKPNQFLILLVYVVDL